MWRENRGWHKCATFDGFVQFHHRHLINETTRPRASLDYIARLKFYRPPLTNVGHRARMQSMTNLGDAIFDEPHVIQCIWDFLQFPTNTGVFSNVFSKSLHRRMHIHIGCICTTFLHYAFSNVSSNCLSEKMHCHIGCICLIFLHCAFLNVLSICLTTGMRIHIGCIFLTYPYPWY